MAETKTIIRKARVDDAQAALNCDKQVWESLRNELPEPWIKENLERLNEPDEEERFQTLIADPTRIILVAEEDGEIIGVAHGRTEEGGLSWLGFIGVTPTHRRRGIGRQLVQEYIKESRTRGASKVSLNTAPQLKTAMKLYADLGFVPEGYLRRHRYGVDLIIYSKFLE